MRVGFDDCSGDGDRFVVNVARGVHHLLRVTRPLVLILGIRITSEIDRVLRTVPGVSAMLAGGMKSAADASGAATEAIVAVIALPSARPQPVHPESANPTYLPYLP